MELNRRHLLTGLGAGMLLATSSRPLLAVSYPDRPVKIVVPFAAGGSVDPAARIVAETMGKLAGGSFIIENKAGAGGSMGADAVARSKPDGYTLLASNNSMTVGQAVYSNLPWKAETDFTYIANFATIPLVILVNTKKVPVNTLPELVRFAEGRSEELTYGSAGTGSAAHLVAEMVKEHAKLKMRHIPYRGAAPAATGLLTGEIDVLVSGLTSVVSFLNNPSMRVIAVSSAQRAPQIPDVHAVAEYFPGFNFTTWVGLAGPAGLPQELVEPLAGWVKDVVADPTVNKRLIDIGLTPGFATGPEVLKTVRQELAAFSEVVQRVGIRPE